MKILHVYKAYPPVVGGIEHHLRLLAERQASRGHGVTVLVASANGRETEAMDNGVRVIRTRPRATVASTPLSPGLVRWMRRLTPEVTHLQFPYPPAEVAQRLLGRSEVTIVSYQSDIVRQRWIGRMYRPLMRRILADADAVLVSSRAYRESSPHLQRPDVDCSIVPLGIDVERFRRPDPERIERLRGGNGVPRVLFVGKMRYYKGLDVLIEAAGDIDAELLLVGGGPMRPALRRLAAQSPASERIRFLGEVSEDDLPVHYAAADVVVLPSSQRSEAFGLALLEGMASGKPVVSTELGTGTSFVNEHGRTGLVVPSRDAGALARAVNTLLRDPDARRRMGENARRRVADEFHVDAMVDRILSVYRKALARRRRSPQ